VSRLSVSDGRRYAPPGNRFRRISRPRRGGPAELRSAEYQYKYLITLLYLADAIANAQSRGQTRGGLRRTIPDPEQMSQAATIKWFGRFANPNLLDGRLSLPSLDLDHGMNLAPVQVEHAHGDGATGAEGPRRPRMLD
jgi:hypothetical protein